jgi:hypothetical protein
MISICLTVSSTKWQAAVLSAGIASLSTTLQLTLPHRPI